MELSTITDLDKLKSLAYDEIAKKEQAENNLRLVNQRILDITTAKNTVVSIAKKKAEMDAKAAADQDPAAASDDSESTDSESTDSESTDEQAADN
jgi:hypothetical protein